MEQIWCTKAKAVSNTHLRKGLCISGSRMLAESSKLKANTALWAKTAGTTVELVQMLLAGHVDAASADKMGAEKLNEALIRQASGAVGAAMAEAPGVGEGYAAKYAQLKHAAVQPRDYFADVADVRAHLAQQMGVCARAAAGALPQLLSSMPPQQKGPLQQWCQQAGVQI